MKDKNRRAELAPKTAPLNPFGEFFKEALGHEPALQESPAEQAVPVSPSAQLKGQTAVVSLDRKGRRGKSVTLIKGLHISPADREELARRLRQACGAGGTLDGETIEIQGDQRDRAEAFLVSLGTKVKRPGG